MGIKNAAEKTIAYAKRNGAKAAFFAALERVSDNLRDKYEYIPPSKEALEEQVKEYKGFAEAGNSVRFSIVVPLFNTPEKYLKEMIGSVIAQTYGNWELVLADASANTSDMALEYVKEDPRIRYFHLDSNEGISENTNKGLAKATGDYIGLLDHDDILTPDALYEVARVIRQSMKKNWLARYSDCPIRLIFSDEDKFDDAKEVYYEHHAKPNFNMDYLMSNNYICHFAVLRADVIKRLKLRSQFDGAQDFDLFLRCCAEAALEMPTCGSQIAHIGKVLYHWRCHKNSTAANPASKTYAYEAGKAALEDLCRRYNIKAEVEMLQHLGFYRINYVPNIFESRKDVGCIGGKLLNKKGRIIGGAYTKDGKVMYAGLPEGYSGGLQHRAVLHQDCYAVDVRCIAVAPALIPIFEEITKLKYEDSYTSALVQAGEHPGTAGGNNVDSGKENSTTSVLVGSDATGKSSGNSQATAVDRCAGMTEEEIIALSLKFGEEMKRRGLRTVWDPRAVVRLDVK
jgi:glycosyltransferase involved in cell wall biosynthesis